MTQFSTREGAAISLDGAADHSPLAIRLSDHMTLTKPGITAMVVITAFIGFAMGAESLLTTSFWTLLAALAGTGLSCMGASALNQIYERDTDALMQRTAARPLPAGRLSTTETAITAALCATLGLAILWLGANMLAAALSAVTIFSYAAIYTPMKRLHHSSTIVGAFPGAMPPVIGYAAATGEVGLPAVLLFAIMFVWQLPHFYAIGYLYREDYGRAGLPILPVIDVDGHRTFRQILITCVALLVVGLLPTLLGVSGWFAFAVALACGLGFLWFAVRLIAEPGRKRARALFLASLAYLPVVLAAVLLDQV